MKHPVLPALSIALSVALSGCSEHAAKTAERSVSPLVGTWSRDGDTPKPNADAPQFTKLSFKPDGTLTATYVQAGGALASIVGKAPKLKTEQDSYATRNGAILTIAEGTSQREFEYRVSDQKLYLTAEGAADAAIFSRSGGDS